MSSKRLQSAAVSELTRIDKRLARLQRGETALLIDLDKTRSLIDELKQTRRTVATLVGGEIAELPAPVTGALRGAEIRKEAVRAAVRSGLNGASLHYKDWYDLLRETGKIPRGLDPLATFLTELGRSPVVKRAGGRGHYALDPDALPRLQVRLDSLRRDSLERTGLSTRERGEILKLERQLERTIDEADSSLHLLDKEGV